LKAKTSLYTLLFQNYRSVSGIRIGLLSFLALAIAACASSEYRAQEESKSNGPRLVELARVPYPIYSYSDGFMSAYAISPDGSYIAQLAAASKTVRLWDWRAQKLVREYLWNPEAYDKPGHRNKSLFFPGSPLLFSPNGRYLAACRDEDDVVPNSRVWARIWDAQTGEILKDIKGPGGKREQCHGLVFSPNSSEMALELSTSPQRVEFYRTDTWEQSDKYELAAGELVGKNLEYSQDGQYFALPMRKYLGPKPNFFIAADYRFSVRILDRASKKIVSERVLHWSYIPSGQNTSSLGSNSQQILSFAPRPYMLRPVTDCETYFEVYPMLDIPTGFSRAEFCDTAKVMQLWNWRNNTVKTLFASPLMPMGPKLYFENNPSINQFEDFISASYVMNGKFIVALKEQFQKDVMMNRSNYGVDKRRTFIELRDEQGKLILEHEIKTLRFGGTLNTSFSSPFFSVTTQDPGHDNFSIRIFEIIGPR
jgi:hypothetical protein